MLAALLGGNALLMLGQPELWFDTVPGVRATGPFNPHLVRDVGAAYFCAAAGLAWQAWRGPRAAPAAWLGVGFLALHAGVHLLDWGAGRCSAAQWLADVPGVTLPALWAAVLARDDRLSTQENPPCGNDGS